MPAVPCVGEETICEVNRDFFSRKEQDGDGHERYSKVLGRVFPRLHFKVRPLEESRKEEEEQVAATPSLFQKLESLILKGFSAAEADADPGIASRAISWHRDKLLLAFASSAARGQVLVVDYEEPEVREPYVLTHDMQQDVASLEWRPNSGSTLAIGCRGGVCIWASTARAGAMTPLGSPSRTGTSRWTQVDFLRFEGAMQVSALSWSPCGRLLACGSLHNATFTVWDVSLGECSPLRRGMAGVHFLNWSPTGDYLLSAMVDSSFYLWETINWTSQPWSASGGTIANAAWSPDGRMLLCAFDKSSTLGTLHFAGKPPSLEVHLLPLELPEIGKAAGPDGHVKMMAWDGTGERLAVSYTGGVDAAYAGLIAIYDTRRTPITSASLLGFVRGPGQDAKPLALAFHHKLRQGALLAVCWSTGVLCVYPLLFRTH